MDRNHSLSVAQLRISENSAFEIFLDPLVLGYNQTAGIENYSLVIELIFLNLLFELILLSYVLKIFSSDLATILVKWCKAFSELY